MCYVSTTTLLHEKKCETNCILMNWILKNEKVLLISKGKKRGYNAQFILLGTKTYLGPWPTRRLQFFIPDFFLRGTWSVLAPVCLTVTAQTSTPITIFEPRPSVTQG